MTRNSLIFGGINSADYDVWISGTDVFSAPERDVEYVSVPGRNGDLIIDNGRWNNIQINYPAFIPHGFDSKVDQFRTEIMKLNGYHKLEDTYHPDEFRLASFSYGLAPTNIAAFLRSGEFNLTFNCKPQRFLKSGEIPLQFLPTTVLANTMYTQYIPVGGDLRFEVHCPAGDELTASVYTYDSAGTQVNSTAFTVANGDAKDVSFGNSDKYFRIIVTGFSDVDKVWLRIQTVSEYDGEPITIDARFARQFEIENPTGYASKPMIEVFDIALPYTSISNMINGVRDSYYVFNSTAASGVDHFYLDCEMQYMYDDSKNNITSHLFLTTAQSAVGEGLVFPELGTDTIELKMYYAASALSNGIGLIQIYPRWWKL